jgi:putative ABC transport system permease protein
MFEVLGIFGGGLLVGFGIAGAIMYGWCLASGWVFSLAPSLFVLNAGVALGCALCSALYPALSAARIEPIEAMHAS